MDVDSGAAAGAEPRADDGEPRFAYNLEPGRSDAIVLVLDDATPVDGAEGLRAALRTLCERLVVVRVAG